MIRQFLIFILLPCACTLVQAQDFDITTIAGCDTDGAYGGDGGSAIAAKFYYPEAVNLDKWGNLYIADVVNCRVRKITFSTGIITTVAGTDTFGYSGDNGLATNAKLYYPEDVLTDSVGNVFFADALNSRVRKVTISTGIITTVAGNGVFGYYGDGGSATNAELNAPSGLFLDKSGNMYIADYWNNVIRKVEAATGIITTIAGTGAYGYSGDNGAATDAEFDGQKVFLDNYNNIFISDQFDNAVRKIDATTGIITTVAGNGTTGYAGNGGLAIDAELSQPAGGYFDKQNNLYIADWGNGTVRKIDATTGIITTVVGNGTQGFLGDGGPATDAELWPYDVILDSSGIMYIADFDNMRIRMVYNTLAVKPLAVIKEISMYPNSINDELYINNAAGYEVKIFNAIGQQVYEAAVTSDKESIDVSSLPVGLYVVRFFNGVTGDVVTRKIIKE